jgi:hypothetical protein
LFDFLSIARYSALPLFTNGDFDLIVIPEPSGYVAVAVFIPLILSAARSRRHRAVPDA